MGERLPVFIGNQAAEEFLRYCQQRGLKDFLLVADENTYQALGKVVEESLRARGYDVLTVVFKDDEVVANEHFLVRVLIKYDLKARTFVSVGSGTLTDITRFTSHRVGREFICMPTAPSVDGFTSIGAPLVVGGLKQTIICQPPSAVFADLPTLVAAPRHMVASGFGDLVGKYISIADWKLGHMLWDERFDDGIAGRMLGAAQDIAGHVQDIAGGSAESIRILMDGLIESGFGMLEFGNSSPAGGAEHHMAHYWEMMMLNDHRHAALHGAKVGMASIIASDWYAQVCKMSKEEAYRRLEKARLPDPQEESLKIRAIFGPIADELIPVQKDFIDMTGAQFEALKLRILDHWQEVHEIAASVPPAEDFTRWLRMLGGPVDGSEVGLSAEDVRLAKDYSHYLRRRFSINKLRLLLGIS